MASGQVVLLELWFSNRTKSFVKGPKLYLADTGLLYALLNIRSEAALRQPLSAGADAANLAFVRDVVGKKRIASGAVVCRAPNSFPLPGGFRALSVVDIV